MYEYIAPILRDIQVRDWLGEYKFNHDGVVGVLSIRQGNLACASSYWCYLDLKYTDLHGRTYPGRIVNMDQNFEHMTFYIDFPNNAQRFDAYLFNSDKARMAGTTYMGGRTLGFCAKKKLLR